MMADAVGKILIVDDEAPIREMVATALELANFDSMEASNAQQAHEKIIDNSPDLVLLDWMMPGTSGLELARRLKRDEVTSEIPIIMLTAKGGEDSKVEGLESGADDYISKPFSTRELIARIKAVLRRGNQKQNKLLKFRDLRLDVDGQRIFIKDKTVNSGPTEFRLLKFFLMHPERAYTRTMLLDHVWGGNVYIEDRTIDVHIRRLRKVLQPAGYDKFIQTVRGTGYRFSMTEQK